MFVSRVIAVLLLAFTVSGCASIANGARHAPDLPSGALAHIESLEVATRPVSGLEPPADIWERMRRGFAMPDFDSALVLERQDWCAQRPTALLRMTEQARKYLFYIVEELELRGMPTELALLPFVESAYNPAAVSSAKAAGMWQFMPATGTYFDLTQNAFRDDRRDVLASTRAALDYLQRLHRMFGDWHLALAAYNWGEGNVGRARAFNQNQGRPTGYMDLVMPEETRWYVPKFQALKNIVRDPAAFGVQLAEIGNHPYFDVVPIARDIDVALAARLAGISEEDFRQLNPSHKGPVIFAAVTQGVLLPWDNARIFAQKLADQQDERLSSWTVWQVPRRMAVAEVARRVGAGERAVLTANAIPRGMLVDAGSTLLVPRSPQAQGNAPAHLVQRGHVRLVKASRER
ncbi:transglycosylase SLT domain-containing protein [Lampropedia cohaerens]|uniref:transglycosylase SLT domain-containing protein n=1 Tax=Lampropedia cohaerens TaxID=1610491 RepID=UPI00069ABF4A|nr:transglycosylase SLT domain-containing protein [Lampropedia cohaerens]